MHFISTHDSCDFQASKTTNEEEKKKSKFLFANHTMDYLENREIPFSLPLAGTAAAASGSPQPASLTATSRVTQHNCILSGSHAS